MEAMLPVKSLFGKFKGASTIALMPGPSLEDSIEAIKEVSKKIFTIAADSALPVCEKHGFLPDFVISVDPQAYISEHFLGFWDKDIRIVTSLSAWNCRLNERASSWKIYCSLNSHPFAQLLEEMFPDKTGELDSGSGSVAGDALLFAYRCGFSEIACAGFDFSFVKGITYSRGAAYQKRYAKFFSSRLKSAETFNFDYIMKSSKALRNEGGFTRRSFIGYRQSVERVVKNFAGVKLFHINPLGSALAACEASGKEILEKLKKTDKGALLAAADSEVRALGKIIDFGELKRVLGNEKIFGELIRRSRGENANVAAYGRLLGQLLGEKS
jgi:hypothetical protein